MLLVSRHCRWCHVCYTPLIDDYRRCFILFHYVLFAIYHSFHFSISIFGYVITPFITIHDIFIFIVMPLRHGSFFDATGRIGARHNTPSVADVFCFWPPQAAYADYGRYIAPPRHAATPLMLVICHGCSASSRFTIYTFIIFVATIFTPPLISRRRHYQTLHYYSRLATFHFFHTQHYDIGNTLAISFSSIM